MTRSHGGSESASPSPELGVVSYFPVFVRGDDMKFHCGLILYFLITNNAEHLSHGFWLFPSSLALVLL